MMEGTAGVEPLMPFDLWVAFGRALKMEGIV